jgi:hypothetical protein
VSFFKVPYCILRDTTREDLYSTSNREIEMKILKVFYLLDRSIVPIYLYQRLLRPEDLAVTILWSSENDISIRVDKT